jgi:hypothetical protein
VYRQYLIVEHDELEAVVSFSNLVTARDVLARDLFIGFGIHVLLLQTVSGHAKHNAHVQHHSPAL